MAHLFLHPPLVDQTQNPWAFGSLGSGVGPAWAGVGLRPPGRTWPRAARFCFRRAIPVEAVAVLREAAKAEPANAWVWNLLGRGLLQLGEPAQAAQAFRSALRADAADGYSQMMLDMLSQKPLSGPEPKPGLRGRSGEPDRHGERSEIRVQTRNVARNPDWGPLWEQGLESTRDRAPGRAPGRGTTPGPKKAAFPPGRTGQGRATGLSCHRASRSAFAAGAARPGTRRSRPWRHRPPGGLVEKDFTLDLAKLTAAALEELGHRAVLTREADYGVPLWARARP